MKKLSQALFIACLYTAGSNIFTGIELIFDKANPAPINSTNNPFSYNYEQAKEDIKKGLNNSGSGLSFSAMPYYARADIGTSFTGIKNTNLGDLSGRVNMLGLFGTPVPNGYAQISPITELLGTLGDSSTVYDPNQVNGGYTSNTGFMIQTLLQSISCYNGTLINPSVASSGVVNPNGIKYAGSNVVVSPATQPFQTPVVTPAQFNSIGGLQSLQNNDTDNPWNEVIGFLTIPMKYRRYGARFELIGTIDCGLGAAMQLGVAAVSQSGSFNNAIIFGNPVITTVSTSSSSGNPTVTTTSNTVPNAAYYLRDGSVQTLVLNPFADPTTNSSGSTITGASTTVTDAEWYQALRNIKSNTTNQIEVIAEVIGLDLSDFQQAGFEDLRAEIFWRKAIKLHTNTPVLFVPFITMFGTLDLSSPTNPNKFFAMPLGSNGHKSIGGSAGFSLDFVEGIEVGGAIGAAAFSSRNEQNLRVPNSLQEYGFYPYTAAAKICPGSSWFVSVLINAYHFEEDLSFFFQYLYVGHNKDKIILNNPDIYFLPQLLEARSVWSSQMANVGLNYNVTPNIAVGAAIQIPLQQLNAYRTSTFGLSICFSN